MSTGFDEVDYFSEPSIVEDPYPYFDWLRDQCPVVQGRRNALMVTGYQEAVAVMGDNGNFSRVNTVGGPIPGLPVQADGDDITDLIEQYRHVFPLNEHVVTFDPPDHQSHRHLLTRLLTPRRLQENEEFFRALADREIDTFHQQGSCEFVRGYAEPYATLTITNVLGVPETDHVRFREAFQTSVLGRIDGAKYSGGHVSHLEEWFTEYIADRRLRPRDDNLTKIALARFPDGSTPPVADVARLSSFLFAAGRGTTVHLLATAVQFLAENPDLQKVLRDDRSKVTNYVEEVLRLESPIKANFRLTRKTTDLGGVEAKAGATVTMLLGASNRDPLQFPNPNALDIDRPNSANHIAFGRGIGSCPGGALARAEARVTLNRVLDRMGDIRVSEEHHGPPHQRRYGYDPSFALRRISELHLEFTPIA